MFYSSPISYFSTLSLLVLPMEDRNLVCQCYSSGLSRVFELLSASGIVTYFLGLCRQSGSRSFASHAFYMVGCAQVC